MSTQTRRDISIDAALSWLADRADDVYFRSLVSKTRDIWEPEGYHVFVDANRKRVTIVKVGG